MTISQITQYLQNLERLVQMQQIELDKTRNLLGRAIDAGGRGEITCDKKEYDVTDGIEFNSSVYPARLIIHGVNCNSLGMKSMYEQIVELKKELNL